MSKKHVYVQVEQLSEGTSLPLEIFWRESAVGLFGAFALAAIFLVLAFISGDLVPEDAFGEYTAQVKTILPLVLLAMALLRLFPVLVRWNTVNHAKVDGRTVTVSTKGWLKRGQWSEPLTHYDGVRWQRYDMRADQDRDTTPRTTHIEPRLRHVIELAHPDEAKTIPLAVKKSGRATIFDYLFSAKGSHSVSNADLRLLWEALAVALGLPAIDARDGASEVRQAQDLDKSIKQLATEGRVQADWKGGAPPPSLAVEQRGSADDPASQQLHVTIHAVSVPRPVLYGLGGMGVFLLLLGIWNLEFGPFVGGLLFGGAAYGIWYLQWNNPNRITITREEIRHDDPLVQRRSFVMPLSEIEGITIRDRDRESVNKRTLKLSGKELLLSTDRTERAIGGGLSNDELEWLRGYLVAAIARED
jgi:hypothetical protein